VSTITGIIERAGSLFDLGEHLRAALAGEVQVEQHQIGPLEARVLTFSTHELHRLNAIADDREHVAHLVIGKGLADQHHIPGVVLDEQDRDQIGVQSFASSAFGRVM
jgi:hypothetical protein